MPRPLPPKCRPASQITAGFDIRPPYQNWIRVVDVRPHGQSVALYLADGEVFYSKRSHTIESRRPDGDDDGDFDN